MEVEARHGVSAHGTRILARQDDRGVDAVRIAERRVEQPPPDTVTLVRRLDREQRQPPQRLAPQGKRRTDHHAVDLRDPGPPWVVGDEVPEAAALTFYCVGGNLRRDLFAVPASVVRERADLDLTRLVDVVRIHQPHGDVHHVLIPRREDSVMRVLVAPDKFGGTLTAPEAAAAIAEGWRDVAPHADVEMLPLSDGGPGFLDALEAALGGERRHVRVRGPLGDAVDASVLVVRDTAYVESAQAAGLHLVPASERDPRAASTYGVGELVALAAPGVHRVVLGLGGTATNDGGAGLWAALGAQPADVLTAGGTGLAALTDVFPPHQLPVSLVAATDVDNPLLGPNGASAVYGPQKGADRAAVLDLDDALRRWADLVEARTGLGGLRDRPGAGAAGGLGFGLLALGATVTSGFGMVAEAVRLQERVGAADLVITGEGKMDAQSLRGKVVVQVAAAAREAAVPCLVVAGQAEVGRRDAAAAGVDDVQSVAETLGTAQAALEAGAGGVRQAAVALARRWVRRE